VIVVAGSGGHCRVALRLPGLQCWFGGYCRVVLRLPGLPFWRRPGKRSAAGQ